jgi:dolichol-phosphate mannosyltransferase
MSDRNTTSSDRRVDLSIVIPCYNEESGVAHMASELQPVLRGLGATASVEVVFVDDGSTDGTWACLSELPDDSLRPARVTRLRHERNRGLGAALKTGLTTATGDIVVTTDSDSTYRFTEIPNLLARLTPGVDIVTASPYHPLGAVEGVPKYRLVLSRGSSLIYRALVGRNIYTYTALFRAYRAEVIRSVDFTSSGYLGVAELLVNAILSGFQVAEYPATLHVRKIGTSKAKILRTIAAHLKFQSLVLLRRLGIKRKPAGKPVPAKLSVSRG